MSTEQKFGLVDRQFGILNDAIKNMRSNINSLALSSSSAEVPLTFSTGLTRTTNTITNDLSTGVASGQTAVGGTGITDKLILKGTTGNGTSGSPAVQITCGNNGATTALTVLNSGNVGIGTTVPGFQLELGDGTTTPAVINIKGSGSGLARYRIGSGSNSAEFSWNETGSASPNGIPTSALGIGTNQNFPFVIATTNTERMRITGTGNVGIGTTAPSTVLDVVGAGRFTTAVSKTQLTVNGTGPIQSGINFASGGTNYGEIYFDNVAPYDMSMYQKWTTGSLILGTNTTERMRITSAGNVGIGITAPTNLLNVKGGLVPLKIEPTGSATDGVSLTLGYSGLTFATTAPSYKTFNIEHTLTGDANGLMNFNNGGATRMTIANAGNVGIGTTTPSYILSLGGDTARIIGMNESTLGVAPSLTLKSADSAASGTNNEGGSLNLSAGLGNGNATTSTIILSTANPISSGGTRQTLTEKMRITSVGNVGIGTTAPAYLLDVNGSAKMTTIRDNMNSVGTSGQVLSSTGSALSWITSSTGYAVLRETKVAGVSSSVVFSGTTTTLRQLNSVANNNLAIVAPVSPNWTFIIPTAGTYSFHGRACYSPASSVIFSNYTTSARLHIRNDTLGLDNAITGDTSLFFREYSTVAKTPDNIWLNIDGILTLTAGSVLSMKQFSVASNAGFNPCIGGTAINVSGVEECYAVLTILKLA